MRRAGCRRCRSIRTLQSNAMKIDAATAGWAPASSNEPTRADGPLRSRLHPAHPHKHLPGDIAKRSPEPAEDDHKWHEYGIGKKPRLLADEQSPSEQRGQGAAAVQHEQ